MPGNQFWSSDRCPQLTLSQFKSTYELKSYSSAWLLSDFQKLWFFHSGLSEVRHWWGIFILLIFVLPVFDHSVDFFLGGLYLIQHFWPLIDSFNIKVKGISLELVLYRLRRPNQSFFILDYFFSIFAVSAYKDPEFIWIDWVMHILRVGSPFKNHPV